MMQLLRLLRTVHGWMGIIVVPWVLLYGLTGFYLNHEGGLAFLLERDQVDELWSEDRPGRLVTEDSAREWFAQTFPSQTIKNIQDEDYHGKPAFILNTGSGSVIAPKNSSFYFEKVSYYRYLHDNAGRIIDSHTYWPRILKELHTHGWLRSGIGTTIADVFSVILIAFGLTGAFLWTGTRLMRLRSRRAGKAGSGR